MLLKKLAGSWFDGIERVITTQQKQNKKLVKLLLNPAAAPPRRASSPGKKNQPFLVIEAPKPAPDEAMPTPGKWLKFTHVSGVLDGRAGATRMNYWLYLPEKKTQGPLPLVVMLHGCAQSATQFAQSTRMNQLAEKKGFAVLYPQQTRLQNGGRCWRWYKKEVQEGGAEVKSVVAIINSVVDGYRLDRRRIYITGISAGAAMAQIIAFTHPQLIAAVGMHSGSVFGVAQTPIEGYKVMQKGAAHSLHEAVRNAVVGQVRFPPMPAILVHGRDDPIVRPINAAHLAEQFRELLHIAGHRRDEMQEKMTEKPAGPRAGNACRIYEYSSGRKVMLKVCEVIGLEHAWSGGDASVSFSDARGPDASKLMWDFFARHKRESGRH